MTGGPITSDSTAESRLPVQRAFVVQLHATTVVAQGQLTGRVEHVLSGQAAHFDTLDELLAFMARVLAGLESTEPSETRMNLLGSSAMDRRTFSKR